MMKYIFAQFYSFQIFGLLLNIKSKNVASVFCAFNTRKHKAPLSVCAGAGLGAVAIMTLFAVSFQTVLSSLFVIIVFSDLNLPHHVFYF